MRLSRKGLVVMVVMALLVVALPLSSSLAAQNAPDTSKQQSTPAPQGYYNYPGYYWCPWFNWNNPNQPNYDWYKNNNGYSNYGWGMGWCW